MEKKIQDIKPIYSWIVDSVVAKARAHFLQDGVDESVLADLKLRWEAKLDASDVYNAEEGVVDDGKEDEREGAKTPEDDSTGGENKSAKGGEPQAKKRKIFPNDPGNVESPEGGTAADGSGNGSGNSSVSDVEKAKDAADLDEDLDDDEPAEGEAGNMVVAQYDKVVRNKNRWKCVMKHGIVHIDGREYVFSKATGEFVF